MTKDCICSAFYVFPKCFCSILRKYKVINSRSMLKILQAIKFLLKLFNGSYQVKLQISNSLEKRMFEIVPKLKKDKDSEREKRV